MFWRTKFRILFSLHIGGQIIRLNLTSINYFNKFDSATTNFYRSHFSHFNGKVSFESNSVKTSQFECKKNNFSQNTFAKWNSHFNEKRWIKMFESTWLHLIKNTFSVMKCVFPVSSIQRVSSRTNQQLTTLSSIHLFNGHSSLTTTPGLYVFSCRMTGCVCVRVFAHLLGKNRPVRMSTVSWTNTTHTHSNSYTLSNGESCLPTNARPIVKITASLNHFSDSFTLLAFHSTHTHTRVWMSIVWSQRLCICQHLQTFAFAQSSLLFGFIKVDHLV